MNMSKQKGISLFSGAGGMDVGFEKAGVDVVLANELDPNVCDTYEANHPNSKLLRGDIKDYYPVFAEQQGIDIVFGGPPCQGFSVAGKMDPGDERSKLIWCFLDVVENDFQWHGKTFEFGHRCIDASRFYGRQQNTCRRLQAACESG
jgi:DNA (cytosine-5)-methyltransferase 1